VSLQQQHVEAAELSARGVGVRAGAVRILDDVDLRARPGAVTGLVGPNGSGKSTLLRAFAGLSRPDDGVVRLDGADVRGLRPRELARRIAVVEQEASTEVDVAVLDVVRLGRVPHRGRWSSGGADDEDAVREAVQQVGIAHLTARRWHQLSGGERQRVHLARALAQQPGCLVLDEPTNHLDVRHQFALLDLLTALPATAVVSLHDLPLAARHCDVVVVLDAGRVVATGPPREALTRELVADVFGVLVDVHAEADGRVGLVYRGLA